ncbi:MAG: hypothetical protein K0U68_11200 [Gammaproteobacteria bacterium]|nr:hypothetical protein [Gammaproteobacteria bacterium]
MTVCCICLFLGYPFISYELQQYQYSAVIPFVVSMFVVSRALKLEDKFRRYGLIGIASLLCIGALFFSRIASQMFPVMIYLVLIWYFGRTLIHPPSLIERFVKLQFSDIPPEVLEYCRRLTMVWTLLFVGIVLVSMMLIMMDNSWYFTLLHGVLVWVLMACLAVSEHLYRLYRFPFMKGQTPSIKETFQSAIQSRDQLL